MSSSSSSGSDSDSDTPMRPYELAEKRQKRKRSTTDGNSSDEDLGSLIAAAAHAVDASSQPKSQQKASKKTKLTAAQRQQRRKQARAQARDMGRYINKQRTLIFATRGITNRHRHLLQDLRDLLPHSKSEVKFDAKKQLQAVNEVADMKNCNNCIFFEARKHRDLYMWVSRVPGGPSAKFLVSSVHTMAETKLTGNCLKGARPLLSFDAAFDSTPAYRLLREMFTQVFGSPKGHPKAKPFIDHVLSFYIVEGRVYFRNYQIVYELDSSQASKDPVLVEIGPRMILTPIRIFEGSFGGATLWQNPDYVSPNVIRQRVGAHKSNRYKDRKRAEAKRAQRSAVLQETDDVLDHVFD